MTVSSVQPVASPPMMPAIDSGPCVVGDDHHVGLEGVFAPVERQQPLALLRPADAQGPVHLVGVEDVQRPVAVVA